jgi:FKBP-type peptidyl-prolyl cis-trans isomerase
MRRISIFLALAAAGLASCNGGYKKGNNGMLYNKYTDKQGPKIQEGDFVSMNMIVKNDEDSVLRSSYDYGTPQVFVVPKAQFKGDVIDGMSLLSEGDSASIKISMDTIFKRNPKPPGLKGKYLIYDLKVEKVISKGKGNDQEFQSKVGAYVQTLESAIKTQEPVKIKKYIDDNKLVTAKTDSGLYYTITTKGSGPLPIPGDTVVVNYTGRFLTGKVFDTNIKELAIKEKLSTNISRAYAPIRFPLGQRQVIAGWDQGLALLNKGSKATFIVPSKLGYGAQGNGNIGPFSPLVFDVELVNIIHRNPNAKPEVQIIPTPRAQLMPIK